MTLVEASLTSSPMRSSEIERHRRARHCRPSGRHGARYCERLRQAGSKRPICRRSRPPRIRRNDPSCQCRAPGLEAMAAALEPPAPIDYLAFAEEHIVLDGPFAGPYRRSTATSFDEILGALSPEPLPVCDPRQLRAVERAAGRIDHQCRPERAGNFASLTPDRCASLQKLASRTINNEAANPADVAALARRCRRRRRSRIARRG